MRNGRLESRLTPTHEVLVTLKSETLNLNPYTVLNSDSITPLLHHSIHSGLAVRGILEPELDCFLQEFDQAPSFFAFAGLNRLAFVAA